jgi:hypothetical protein
MLDGDCSVELPLVIARGDSFYRRCGGAAASAAYGKVVTLRRRSIAQCVDGFHRGVYWLETVRGLNHLPCEVIPLSLLFAWMISPILLIWSNATLVIEAVEERPTRAESISVDTATLS